MKTAYAAVKGFEIMCMFYKKGRFELLKYNQEMFMVKLELLSMS